MSGERRKFKRATAQERKEALILATLELVAEKGVRGATVRDIAERADVTQGLIRHYFSSKEDLMTAAYEHHMVFISDLTFAPVAGMAGTARARLAGFVEASLLPPVVEPTAVALWAGFLNKVQQDPQMRQIHQRTYDYFRDKLGELIAAALDEAGVPVDAARLHHLAVACNAVIDGLWMEGGALPEAFEEGELPTIGLESVGAILGLNLQHKAEQP
ncbi:TetR/AcrR family transcriptional regulator [Phaeobacter gallaeciensis]|uniref:Transcriptional regulator, TetR family n=1 Tax=Phaeobacter gallaeciensis TaxID=60890 RepID=A0AAD0EEV1_9RHOB|nr:TetR family transcriptional regulator C-terminal domain-containing protein [Phaeobacter gallaeciensis]AHD11661.1 transcriptional regulator, TetR family [Phaeobacter gallaeciensis DSM 26640]ATE94925.1 putative transcriptional regulator, TetR family [Phaeobacter gallaeciensis]ATE99196.1 putative transcriptional regulator, TetR family [Phaeobacter gallaeciensis]ATF03589.1 putative transcriptional regulator, TetR family [Phaeobacter gallaeciensis]ATF07969.1 putative transcriptional regulator, T